MDEQKVLEVTDKLCDDLNNKELTLLGELMLKMKDYQKKELSYEEMDQVLLFTPTKVKEIAYKIQATMYPDHQIRGQFETKIEYTKQDEEEDIQSVFEAVKKQAKSRDK